MRSQNLSFCRTDLIIKEAFTGGLFYMADPQTTTMIPCSLLCRLLYPHAYCPPTSTMHSTHCPFPALLYPALLQLEVRSGGSGETAKGGRIIKHHNTELSCTSHTSPPFATIKQCFLNSFATIQQQCFWTVVVQLSGIAVGKPQTSLICNLSYFSLSKKSASSRLSIEVEIYLD